jgi:hypothetical protein
MILPNKKIKIALIGYRLSTGGMKSDGHLSPFFWKQGLEVHNIIVLIPFRMPIQEISQFGENEKMLPTVF